jgi:NADPH:quinone reductase-like Zn-dependent oxidoreductase
MDVKAALFHRHGGPEVVRVEEVDLPEPGTGEVRIRVRASSINHLDLWVRRGLPIRIPMPHIGGSDLAGLVDAVGAGVSPDAVGARVVVDPTLDWDWVLGLRRGVGLEDPFFRVIGEHTQGGFAEYAVVPAANLLPLPESVSFETAAASSLVFVTAWRGLVTRGGLRAGERVLITGGSGGVATAAVQLARIAGAEVFVLTSGEENVGRLLSLGAHRVIDRNAREVGPLLRETLGSRGVDLILDSVGEAIWGDLLRALAPQGRLVTYGATSGPRAPTDLRHVFWKQLSILGTSMGSPADFQAVMKVVFGGTVKPVIDAVVPLEGVAEAQARLEAGQVFGKIVVTPS